MEPSTRRAVVYARISVAAEQSVSIDRQVASARQYAAARGWEVVGVFVDDGVSASHNRPEDRAGWSSLLESPASYDTVLIWKIDRLARRVLDFLHADAALQERGAAIAAVEDPIDMTTATGRAFATMLAVFGEMEAEAIRARVAAARRALLTSGRLPGGTVPYGWRSVPNPDGPGYVLAQDPERIEFVRGMAERVGRGETVYSVVQWLDEVGAPLPTSSQQRRRGSQWTYSTVVRLLRNPVLAGMTTYTPGNTSKERGAELLRGPDGLPVVDDSVAVLSVAEWRALVAHLDDRSDPRRAPRALRARTSGLLSGLVWCAEHPEPVRMHRGTTQGRPGYSCPECHQTITSFEDAVVEHFLEQKGDHVRWGQLREVYEGGAAVIPEIEVRLTELAAELQATDDDERAEALTTQMTTLRRLRREKRAEAPEVRWVQVRSKHENYREDWEAADDDVERRAVLGDALDRLLVRRGRPGRRTRAGLLARLTFEWAGDPAVIGPVEEPSQADLAAWADDV